MALADLEARILRDARLEAETIIEEAEELKRKQIHAVKRQLKEQSVAATQARKQHHEEELDRERMLGNLINQQRVLTVKRQLLERMVHDIVRTILNDDTLLRRFYGKQILRCARYFGDGTQLITTPEHEVLVDQVCADCGVNVLVVAQAHEPGTLWCDTGTSRLDCSVQTIVKDVLREREASVIGGLCPDQ
jgi:vacuolar-type H+-ATPase subunit E/Vma4